MAVLERSGKAPPGPSPSRRPAELWITVGLVGVVAASLAALAAATGWSETWGALKTLSAAEIGVLLALSLVNYIVRAVRWVICCRVIGVPVSALRALLHYLAGFAMTVTPGRLGELVRLRWIRQETGFPYDRALPLMLVDRAADLASVGLLLALCMALSAGGVAGVLPVAILAILVAAVLTRQTLALWGVTRAWRLVGRWPKLFARVRRAARTLGPFSRITVMGPALALGAAGWFAEAYAFWLLLGWFGAEVELWAAAAIFLLAMVTGGATGTPGGLGGTEAAMVALLALQGISLEIAVPATIVIRLTTLWFAIAIGVALFPVATLRARAAEAAR